MGISWIQSIRAEHSNMKIFVVLSAVVAATYAKADADAGILGLGLYGYGYGYGLKSAPCVNAANVPVPCAAGVHLIGNERLRLMLDILVVMVTTLASVRPKLNLRLMLDILDISVDTMVVIIPVTSEV